MAQRLLFHRENCPLHKVQNANTIQCVDCQHRQHGSMATWWSKCASILASDIPLLETLETPISASTVPSKEETEKEQSIRSYFGDSKTSPDLAFYYGADVPTGARICSNGLFSFGQQTQLYCRSILWKYPYLHPVAIVYSLLFLWFMDWNIRIINIVTTLSITFVIGESLKIARHASMETAIDVIKMVAQHIGDVLLIPYQFFVHHQDFPLIQFQNTPMNRHLVSRCKSMFTFTPTFWARNAMIQFIGVCLEEQFSSLIESYKVYRECIQTPDGGLIALDYWIDTLSQPLDGDECKEEMAHFEDRNECKYESKTYFQFSDDPKQSLYRRYQFPNGESTPILFIFSTYCGDSMSIPVRKMAQRFCSNGWRVVVYVKRGCGSPYFEFLPLLSHRTFDLSGMDEAHLAIKRVVDRYPNAPKVAMGFSLGGSQLQDFMARFNEEHRYFAAGIKVDGVNNWVELVPFGDRQKVISKVLGESM